MERLSRGYIDAIWEFIRQTRTKLFFSAIDLSTEIGAGDQKTEAEKILG